MGGATGSSRRMAGRIKTATEKDFMAVVNPCGMRAY
jgi:hypothetical protein